MSTRIRRTRILIDRQVQGSVLRKIAIHWMAFFACNVLALTIWIRVFDQPDVGWAATLGDTLKQFLPFFVISLALIPAFVWDTIKLTNRFAGPVRRLKEALANARKGEPVDPLEFRENDFWKELASDFNQLLERVPANRDAESEAAESGEAT
ncbi:MAG: hypothetical protein AB8G99_06720 [Planctomycetaceae bacterium]